MKPAGIRHGVARVLSKAGLCSRSEAAKWIAAGRVTVDGRIVRNPEFPIEAPGMQVAVDGLALQPVAPVHLMLNKPRGLVTTRSDEAGRATIYRCLEGAQLPWVAPVGRLDKASEGLLLLSNDSTWAARITDPATGPDKTYHVQVDTIPEPETLAALAEGIEVDGELLSVKAATLLRAGSRHAWLEIVLDEGRNRQIRRLLGALDIGVLRLVRVAIGELALGELPKGQWRMLSEEEVASLG